MKKKNMFIVFVVGFRDYVKSFTNGKIEYTNNVDEAIKVDWKTAKEIIIAGQNSLCKVLTIKNVKDISKAKDFDDYINNRRYKPVEIR